MGVEINTGHQIKLEDSYKLEMLIGEKTRLAFEKKLDANIKQWIEEEREDVHNLLLDLSGKLGKQEVLIFDSKSELVGGLILQSDMVLWSAIDLLLLDGDSLTISDSSAKNGILLDYFEEITKSGPVMKYELLVWGSDWLKLLKPN